MALPFALAAAGTGLQLYGKYRQVQVDGQMAKINARQLKKEASAIQDQAQDDVDLAINVQAANRGSIVASFAARGIDVGVSTTPVDALLTQLRVDELNNARTIYNADLQAYNLRYQAKMVKFNQKMNKQQAIIGAFGDLASLGGQSFGGAKK